MKKLMIAAAAAAMIGGVQAMTCAKGKDACGVGTEGAGSAYKVAISLKTTENKTKTIKNTCDPDECIYWRQQTTKKIDGLIWQKLDDCYGCYDFDGALSAFWTKSGAIDAEFAIGVGLIGKDGKKLEAFGGLSGDTFGQLTWAGFGSMVSSVKKNTCDPDECVVYPKSISGGIAGFLFPPEDDPCQVCEPIEYTCCDAMVLENRAAYGTIKISYDQSTAKKVALMDDDVVDQISAFYKLPAAAAADYAAGVVESAEVLIEE